MNYTSVLTEQASEIMAIIFSAILLLLLVAGLIYFFVVDYKQSKERKKLYEERTKLEIEYYKKELSKKDTK